MKSSLVLLIFLGFSFAGSATQAACLDQKVVQEFTRHFSVVLGVGTDETRLDYCDPQSRAHRVIESLQFIRTLSLAGSADAIDRKIMGNDPWGFLKKYARRIRLANKSEGSCKGGMAVAYVSTDDPTTMQICPQFNKMTVYEAASVLLHEARHMDVANAHFPHDICTHGVFAPYHAYACDPDYGFKGSYSVSVEYFAKVARSQKVDIETRLQARGEALSYLMQRFNEMPLEMEEGVLVQQHSGDVLFWGSESRKLWTGHSDDILALRADMPMILNAQKGAAQTYYYGAGFYPAAGNYAHEFRRASYEQRQKLMDVFYVKPGVSCRLFEQELNCHFEEVETSLPFTHIQPRSLSLEKERFFLSDRSGNLFSLPTDFVGMKKTTEKNLKKIRNEFHAVQILSLGSYRLVLDDRGQLVMTEKGQFVNSHDLKAKKIVGPLFYSPLLEKL